MASFGKSIIFTLLILGFFVYVCYYVTGLSGGSGGGEAKGVNPEAGEQIYWGDGQCSTCHSIGSSGSATRGPNQEGLAARADERAKERGLASGLEYLIESIVTPGEYVVEGFDNIMPKVYDAPILLEREQIMAVLSYLQTLGGEPDIVAINKLKDKIPQASKRKVVPWIPPIEVEASVGDHRGLLRAVRLRDVHLFAFDEDATMDATFKSLCRATGSSRSTRSSTRVVSIVVGVILATLGVIQLVRGFGGGTTSCSAAPWSCSSWRFSDGPPPGSRSASSACSRRWSSCRCR